MSPYDRAILDMDHVVTRDGNVYRVVGNLDSRDYFLGYNVYSPDPDGDRLYRTRRYRKNLIEDEQLPADALDTYRLIAVDQILEHHDPIAAASSTVESLRSTVWFDLYMELAQIAGRESVGIFGSSMFGLHLTAQGTVRKDVDFVLQDLPNIQTLREALPGIRQRLGFTPISRERQLRQHTRYERIFRNRNNSIQTIISRRWAGLQLSDDVVTTVRLRSPTAALPIGLTVSTPSGRDATISGEITDADNSNFFPRRFTLRTAGADIEVYIFWWKFSTPVRDGDKVALCGSLFAGEEGSIVRLSNYTRHWLNIAT